MVLRKSQLILGKVYGFCFYSTTMHILLEDIGPFTNTSFPGQACKEGGDAKKN